MTKVSVDSGFTIIELIASLVLLGIIGVFGSLFIVNMVKSYQWTTDNAHFVQKVHIALTRISVEIAYAKADTVNITNDVVTYNVTYPDGIEIDGIQIGWNENSSSLFLNNNVSEYVLLDGVSSFRIEDEDSDGHFTVFMFAEGANGVPRKFVKSFVKP